MIISTDMHLQNLTVNHLKQRQLFQCSCSYPQWGNVWRYLYQIPDTHEIHCPRWQWPEWICPSLCISQVLTSTSVCVMYLVPCFNLVFTTLPIDTPYKLSTPTAHKSINNGVDCKIHFLVYRLKWWVELWWKATAHKCNSTFLSSSQHRPFLAVVTALQTSSCVLNAFCYRSYWLGSFVCN